MATSGNTAVDNIVRSILGSLDRNVIPKVKKNAEVVELFTKALQEEINKSSGVLRKASVLSGSDIMHGGSAYEGLAVKTKTDFDMHLVLNEPFVASNYQIHRDPCSKFFKLQSKKPLSGLSIWHDRFGFINSTKLKREIFQELTQCVRTMKVPGVEVLQCNEGLAAFTMKLRSCYTTDIISVDIAPQIAAREWKNCPDLVHLHTLPGTLQSYINNMNNAPVFSFSFGVPGEGHANDNHFNISFTMLEKKFLKTNTNVRDMVRVVKLLAVAYDWKKKYGLKSFLIKRTAVKHVNDLRTKQLWNGHRALLTHIFNELSHGTIDGVFVRNQVIYNKPCEKVAEFKMALRSAINMSPDQLIHDTRILVT